MALSLDTPLQCTVGRGYPRAAQPINIQIPLKDHQLAMLQKCFDIEKAALMSPYKMGFMGDAVAAGKCFAPGTQVLMYSGHIKNVEDVQIDDLLMGDDSTPRRVLRLGQGTDDMFEIKPDSGPSYTVNSEHILCLQHKVTQADHLLTVRELLSADCVSCFQGYRTPVFHKHLDTKIDAYDVGTWLCGGHIKDSITFN